MKKKLWMLGAAVVALTSCTQSEMVDIPESKIVGFDSFIGKSSRALVSETTNNMTKMHIFGYKVASNQNFGTKTDGNPNYEKVFSTLNYVTAERDQAGEWSYKPLSYWQPSTKYRFAAYASSNESTELSYIEYDPVNDNVIITNPNVDENSHDLVVAISGDRTTGEPLTQPDVAKIPFTFVHAYSRVRFTFTDASNVSLKVEDLRIINASHSGIGTYTSSALDDGVGDVVWNPDYGDDNIGYTYVNPIILPTASATSDERLVIPQVLSGKTENTADDVKVSFNLVTYSSHTDANGSTTESIIRTIPIALPLASGEITKWESGRIYNYHMTFGSNYNEIQISFTVSKIYTWDSNLDNDVTTEGDHIDLIYEGTIDGGEGEGNDDGSEGV